MDIDADLVSEEGRSSRDDEEEIDMLNGITASWTPTSFQMESMVLIQGEIVRVLERSTFEQQISSSRTGLAAIFVVWSCGRVHRHNEDVICASSFLLQASQPLGPMKFIDVDFAVFVYRKAPTLKDLADVTLARR
jgi:hypothetical protein